MKQALFLLAAICLGISSKAQNTIGIENTSCSAVNVVIYATAANRPCESQYQSIMYNVPAGTVAHFNMYGSVAGSTLITWSGGTPPAGCIPQSVKMTDPAMTWGNGLVKPGCGSGGAFGPVGCGLYGTISVWNTSNVYLKIIP